MNKTPNPKKSEALQSGEKQANPAVKAWLENVIVPAMVKQYIESKSAQIQKEGMPNLKSGVGSLPQ